MERDWAFSSCRSSGGAGHPQAQLVIRSPFPFFAYPGEALLPSARTREPLKKPAAVCIEAKEPLNKIGCGARQKQKILSTFVDRIFAFRPAGTGKDGFHGKTHLLSQVRFSVNGVRKRWICVFDRWIRTLEAFFFPRKGISAPPYDSSHKAGR